MAGCMLLGGIALALNLSAALLMMLDKGRARARRPRVTEKRFHALAALGAGPGILLAIAAVRHKNRKPRFLAPLALAGLAGVAAWALLLRLAGCL